MKTSKREREGKGRKRGIERRERGIKRRVYMYRQKIYSFLLKKYPAMSSNNKSCKNLDQVARMSSCLV